MKPIGLKRRAFTLVELLVVIAITGGLIALLFSSLASLQSQARTTECIARLKATGHAVLTFATDHHDRVMLAWAPPDPGVIAANPNLQGNPQVGYMWYQYLLEKKYLDHGRTLVCPSFTPFTYYADRPNESAMKTFGLRRGIGNTAYEYPAILSQIDRPASFAILADTSKPAAWDGQSYYFTIPGNRSDTIHPRHRDRANFFFLDGSVASLTPQEAIQRDSTLNNNAFDWKHYPATHLR